MDEIIKESKLVIENNSIFSDELIQKIRLLTEEEKKYLDKTLKDYVRELSIKEYEELKKERLNGKFVKQKLSDEEFYSMLN